MLPGEAHCGPEGDKEGKEQENGGHGIPEHERRRVAVARVARATRLVPQLRLRGTKHSMKR